MDNSFTGADSSILYLESEYEEGFWILVSTDDPNYQGFYTVEITLTLQYNGNLRFDASQTFEYYLDLRVAQIVSYSFCPTSYGGTGAISPTLDHCEIFYSAANAASLDCPPAAGYEICGKITQYVDSVEYETKVIKVDSDGQVWTPSSTSLTGWTIDPDYTDSAFSSAQSYEYTGTVVYDLVLEDACESTFDPGTADIIYEVEEDCYDSSEARSPYSNL